MRKTRMLYVGIDLGTSAVKLLLMNGQGEIKKIVSREYPLYFPKPGWSEQNPEDWYEKTMEGLKELLSDCDKARMPESASEARCTALSFSTRTIR